MAILSTLVWSNLPDYFIFIHVITEHYHLLVLPSFITQKQLSFGCGYPKNYS